MSAPRQSCRPCAWLAITPVARTSCAFAARITAGGRRAAGVGNPMPADSTYTLKTWTTCRCATRSARHRLRAVNPLQALHPNAGAPGDSTLVDSSRHAHFDREEYAAWLRRLRDVCTERGIPLIFDEVFVGFRLAPGGAQEYFGVQADMVTYGKSLGGGLPVGVLCGKAALMKRFQEDRPADICFARGTFNSHPYVMGAMNEFLQRLERSPEIYGLYDNLDAIWNARAARLNQRLSDAGLPLQIRNLSTIWTVCYTRPARYNWMLQFYLRAQGLSLSWVGTGRFIFSLNYTNADFEVVADRIVAGARAMEMDGWWWRSPQLTDRAIKRRISREMLRARLGRPPVSAAPPSPSEAPVVRRG